MFLSVCLLLGGCGVESIERLVRYMIEAEVGFVEKFASCKETIVRCLEGRELKAESPVALWGTLSLVTECLAVTKASYRLVLSQQNRRQLF
mgnify:CR=1 FL=1